MSNKKTIGIVILSLVFMILCGISTGVPKWQARITDQEIFSLLVLCSIIMYLVWVIGKLKKKIEHSPLPPGEDADVGASATYDAGEVLNI